MHGSVRIRVLAWLGVALLALLGIVAIVPSAETPRSPGRGPRAAEEDVPGAPDQTGEHEGEQIVKRDDWFHEQRAFPRQSIPPGALARAQAQAQAVRRSTARGPQTPATASTLSWSEIG